MRGDASAAQEAGTRNVMAAAMTVPGPVGIQGDRAMAPWGIMG